MGLSSKKTKTQSTQNQNTSMTTTPTNPGYVDAGLESLAGRIGNLSNIDPYSLIAGPDALQTQAGQGAVGLTSPQAFQDAIRMMSQAGGAGANTYAPTTAAGTQLGPAAQFGGVNVGPVSQYGGANAGEAAKFGGVQLGPVQQAQSSSVLDGLSNYMSPYTKDVVDASLADYDFGAGMTRAQQALDFAGNTGFSGSRSGITQALTEGELARGRGSLSAGLRDQGFGRGAALSEGDANRRQQVSMFNAGNDLQRSLAQGGFDQQTGLSNTAAENTVRQLQAQLQQQAGLFNAGAQNDRTLTQAGLDQQTGLANVGAQNTRALAQGGFDQQTSFANMDALNQGGQFNAGQQDSALARQLAAGQGLAGIGSAQGADARANIGTQADIGSMLQQLAQQRAGAPLALLGAQAGLFGGLPLGLVHGQNATGTMSGTSTGKTTESGATLSDWLSMFGQMAGGAS